MSRFPFLIDEPADGYMEETGWLPIAAAATPGDAVAEFVRLYRDGIGGHPLDDRTDDSQLVCTGRVFEQPYVTRFSESETETETCATCGHRKVVHTGRCTMSMTRGADSRPCTCTEFVPVIEYAEEETELFGDAAWAAVAAGHASDEDIRYRTCQATDDGAEEFWRIDVDTAIGIRDRLLVRAAQFIEAYAQSVGGKSAAIAWLDDAANLIGDIPIDNAAERDALAEARAA